MKLDDFNYTLPENLIAKYPAKQRTCSRLLCLNRQTGDIAHQQFFDLDALLKPSDLLVFNNSRVIPARLFAQKASGGQAEILIERILNDHEALAHVRCSRSPKAGSVLIVNSHLRFEVMGRQADLFHLKSLESGNLIGLLERFGHIPLPPYIDRKDELEDKERYQTVYAAPKGSVAAPTAGLHFDEALLSRLQAKGIETAFVTLHVGAGTFAPVRTENIKDHHMHSEIIEVNQAVCDQINQAKADKRRIIAVGTTSVRVLESASQGGKLAPYQGETHIFIYPGYQFQCVDGLITNFHLPKSTLLMLVSALTGRDHLFNAYAKAIENGYRFYSYGDAMLIL